MVKQNKNGVVMACVIQTICIQSKLMEIYSLHSQNQLTISKMQALGQMFFMTFVHFCDVFSIKQKDCTNKPHIDRVIAWSLYGSMLHHQKI